MCPVCASLRDMNTGRGSVAVVEDRRNNGDEIDLTSEEEEALLQSIAEDERDEVISWEELLDRLRPR
jgi:hypothetical protein